MVWTYNFCCNHHVIQSKKSYHREMCLKTTDIIANRVDSCQTAPGSALLPEPVCPKTWSHFSNFLFYLNAGIFQIGLKFLC